MLSRTASMHTCGGFYARLACSSHTKSHLVAFQGRLMWLVNFISHYINENETAISLPVKRVFQNMLEIDLRRDDLLVSDLVAKYEAEDSGQQDTYGGLNHIQHIHKGGYTANCL